MAVNLRTDLTARNYAHNALWILDVLHESEGMSPKENDAIATVIDTLHERMGIEPKDEP